MTAPISPTSPTSPTSPASPTSLALADLAVGPELGRGGAGAVFALDGSPPGFGPGAGDRPLVLKRFHDGRPVDHDALAAFVGWRRDLDPAERALVDRSATWPLAVVTDRGAPLGFVMTRVPGDFHQRLRLPSGTRRDVLRELQHLLVDDRRARRLGLRAVPLDQRVHVVLAVIDIVALLHRRGVVVGDLSPRNVLWRLDPAAALLVDCDSFSLAGVGTPVATPSTVDWNDPAARAAATAPTPASDVYKIGLLLVRALNGRFQSRDTREVEHRLDATGRWLVRASLADEPAARPPMSAWERWAADRRAQAFNGTPVLAVSAAENGSGPRARIEEET